jgi:hypothetical protein
MRTPSLALLAAGVLAVAGCATTDPGGAEPSPSPSPTVAAPSPSPTPTPLPPVTGQREATVVDVGDAKVLGPDDREAVDTAAVDAFSTAVFDWLDAHLDDLQRGGVGRLDELLDGATAASLDGPTRTGLTTGLASPTAPVGSAVYTLTAYHDATIEWATVQVAVTDPSGDPRAATLLLAPGPEGQPVLSVAEVAR